MNWASETYPRPISVADIEAIRTHNGTPVTAENLRFAATHAAMTMSWTFDVLQGLADLLAPHTLPPVPVPAEAIEELRGLAARIPNGALMSDAEFAITTLLATVDQVAAQANEGQGDEA